MKKKLVFWLLGLILSVQAFAQTRTISGTVTDAETGEALIGVNVTGKGTDVGTVTDIDGNYTIDLSKEVTTLVFSYVGFTTIEKPITSLVINATMGEDAQLMDEVVITGMQIKREKRSTSFANNTVKSDDFNKTAVNPFSALQAKTPGVQISNASGAVGSSTRIILQGPASFGGNNNALIVVDGNPINNNVSSNGTGSNGFIDFGNRGNDINPDDIESITVLKGPAAVAIYGSRGTSGVILITTKGGSAYKEGGKNFNVNVNTGMTFDKAYLLIKRQDRWGQGYDFAPDPIENFSWGPAFDGLIRPWTPVVVDENGVSSQLIRPYSAVEDQLQAGFNTGITSEAGISFDGSTQKASYYFSYGNLNNKGIFDNNYYKRHNFMGNASFKFGEKLTSRLNTQYIKTNQRALLGAGTGNFGGPFQALLQQAVNIPINELRDYNNLYQGFEGYYGGYTANPFYLMNNINNDLKSDNLIASVELEYKPVSFFTLTSRVGNNFSLGQITIENPKYTYVHGDEDIGQYFENYTKRNNLNIDLFGTFNKEIVKDLNMSLMAGYNFNKITSSSLSSQTEGGLVVPGFYDLSNSVGVPSTTNASSQYAIMGLYGQFTMGWRNMLFAEYTARNDWSSTLPAGNRGFFYQGGGLSFVPTELFKTPNKWISYLKLRGNAGTQGKDAGLYLLESTFSANPTFSDYFGGNMPIIFPFPTTGGGSVSAFTLNNFIGNPDLKPENTFEWSVGADVDLLHDYLHVEYTYYDKLSKDLIVNVQLPPSSGYTTAAKNVGELSNKGHELLARVYVLKNIKDINWNFRFQFAKNNSKVLKVSDENDELSLSNGGVQVVVKEGMPFGTFKAYDFARTETGNIIVGTDGAPVAAQDFSYYDSYLPKYTMGFGSNFSWKGLSVDVQFDLKQGGIFYSGTKNATDFNGTSLTSTVNDRQPYIVPGSVQDLGDGTYVENTTPVTNLFTMIGSLPEAQDLIDGSYLKLREASISYTLDKKFFKNTAISSITIGLVGRNLKFWLPSENTFADPESNSFGYNGNIQGLEFSSTPQSRSIGFDFNIKF